jgi:hypothetical protein
VPSAGQPHRYVKGVTRMAKTPGCNLSGAAAVVMVGRLPGRLLQPVPNLCTASSEPRSWPGSRQPQPQQRMALVPAVPADAKCKAVCLLAGFVLVKKVPGTLHLLAKSPGHSFDFVAMNMSHVVHQWFFGNKPSPRRRSVRAPLDHRLKMFACRPCLAHRDAGPACTACC